MNKKTLFISWSGDLSKNIAEEIKLFLEESLHAVIPFFSPDIQKGAGWLDEINKAIDNSVAGIICLTKENYTKPWVLFESGALSRVGLVCPIVFDMKKEEIKSPLNIFQASEFNKKEFKKLFEDLCEKCSSGLTQKVIDRYFEDNSNFEKLEVRINNIIKNYSFSSTNSPDETQLLLQSINEKINKLSENTSVDIEIEYNYLKSQIASFNKLILKLDPKFKLENKEELLSIFISIDYFLSITPDSVKKSEQEVILEQLNKELNTL